MTQIVKLGMGIRNQHGPSFDYDMVSYLAHETRLLSEIQQIDPEFTETGQTYVFRLHLTFGLDVEFGFSNLKDARQTRGDIVLSMMEFWGPDQIILSNGTEHEVTIVAAVADITEIFGKEHRFGFSLLVAGVPHPVNLIFLEKPLAEQARLSISEKLENYRRCRVKTRNQEPAAVNG